MYPLTVSHLRKTYSGFALNDVSFTIEQGKIAGFIGRNGAGKTTTLKSLLNLVHPDAGEILFFGQPFASNEFAIKQKIGFVAGGIDYYPKKRIKTITNVTKRFYPQWDEQAYRCYMAQFKLDERHTPDQLSQGMRIKYALTLALSHHASLLILDEPTSGLDPVSRDDLLDVFINLTEQENVSILFSTHITSDLEKCADQIIYMKNGTIVHSNSMDSFLQQYRMVQLTEQELTNEIKEKLIGCKKNRYGYSALVKTALLPLEAGKITNAGLEDIMIHIEKES